MPRIKITDLPKALLGLDVTTTTTQPIDQTPFVNDIVQPQGATNLLNFGNKQKASQFGSPFVFNPNTFSRAIQQYGNVTTTTTLKVEPGPCPKGFIKNKKGECVPKRSGLSYANDMIQGSLAAGSAFGRFFQNQEDQKAAEAKMAMKSFGKPKPGGAIAFGKTQLNEGVEFPNMLTPPNEGQYLGEYFGRTMGEFGGSFPSTPSGPVKIKIIGEPDTEVMKYGGQSNYGFDSGWKRSYTEMNKTSADHYKQSMSEDKNTDEKPVLEAEGGETLYKPGDQAFYNLTGNKHYDGGIELTGSQVNSKNQDIPSFIFSDTKALKIKDKDILDYFGVTYKKGGVTPAEISKKYPLNKWKAILNDPNSDKYDTDTANLMLEKNEKVLAELAAIQEGMKGLRPPKFAEQTLKQGKVAYGGFVPMYAPGGLTTGTTTKSPTEGTVFTPEQLRAFGTKKVGISAKMKAGDTKVALHQPGTKGAPGLYGGIKPEDVEDLKARHRWYFDKHSDWDPTNPDDVGDFQKTYNEEYAKKHGYVYFVPKGSKEDRKFNRLDNLLGEYTYNAPSLDEEQPPVAPPASPAKTPPPAVGPRYFCDPDGKGGGVVKQLPEGSTGGYSSPEEASKHCGKRPIKTPYDFLAPDKLNMLAHAAVFPRKIFPFMPDLAYNKRPLALEDWRTKAAQRFSTQYAAPSAQLAVYGPTQGLGSQLSFLAGQTGQQMAAEDIAPTISRNIDRVNAYTTSEGQRQDVIDQYNAMQKQKRWEGYATTLQNYDNAMRQYLKENSDAFTRAWKNRMHLGAINATNPNFAVHPTSGQQYWKGNAFYTGAGGDGGGSDLGKMYSLYYNQYLEDMKSDIPDETERKKAARELAMSAIRADRYSETTDPYSNKTRRRTSGYDFDFNPTSS